MRRSLLVLLPALAALLLLAPGAGARTHRVAALSITPSTLPAATVGTAYSQALTGNGGTGPYTFAVTGGSLTPGLSLSNAGLLSGTPTSAGNYAFTITATDSLNATIAQGFTLSVSPAAVSMTPTSLTPAQRGVPYAATLTGAGGTAPYTFAVTAGTLPVGLALSNAGVVTGSPGAVGSFTFTVTATDSRSSAGARTYTLNVNPSAPDITPSALGDAAAGAAYTAVLSGTGGTAPYTFALASGYTMPPGLVLSASGIVTGTPSSGGTFPFRIQVQDANGVIAVRDYVLRVVLNALTVTGTPADAKYGRAYSFSFAASGGSSPYAYSLAGGALPNGVLLTSAGALTGTPTSWGTFSFSVRATDVYGSTGTFPFTLLVAAPSMTLTPQTLFAATSGIFYSARFDASGGLGTYSYAIASGSLPNGLALGADGVITGIPNDRPGAYPFSVSVTDAYGATGTIAMSVKLATPSILATSVALPIGTAGTAYAYTLGATGGTEPYTFALVDGALPQGLALLPNGTFSGTPATTGTYLLSILITDANNTSVTQTFRLVVEAAGKVPVKHTPVKKKKTAKRR